MAVINNGGTRKFEDAIGWLNISCPKKDGELVKSPKNASFVASNKRQSAWSAKYEAELDAVNAALVAEGKDPVNTFKIADAEVWYQRVTEHEDDGDLY